MCIKQDIRNIQYTHKTGSTAERMEKDRHFITIEQIAHTLRDRDVFTIKYTECKYAHIIFSDIMVLIQDILRRKVSFTYAIRVLHVYYVILRETKKITVREVYYRCKRVFAEQSQTQRTVEHIQKRLETEINVVSSYKGLVHGRCTIKRESTEIDLSHTSLIPYIVPGDLLVTDKAIIIVVEKEAVFNDLVQNTEKIENSLGQGVLIVTGKGYPCKNTLLFLRLAEGIPILGLFDCDPHGLSIYAVYKYGSKRRPHLKVPGMQRIGLFLVDLPTVKGLLCITQQKEYQMVRNLAETHQELKEEINMLIMIGKKASIEDITHTKYLEEYIVDKIKRIATIPPTD